MAKPATWKEAKAKADALWERSRSPLAWEIFDLFGAADENARCTVPSTSPDAEYEAMALGSLECLLASRDFSDKARAWAKRIGVRF